MSQDVHSDIQNITIETIDQAIYDWLNKTVDSHVEHPNGDRKKVHVTMASGERWVTGRQRKGIRDRNGLIILPVISLRRTGVTLDPSMSAMSLETPNLQISRIISDKTNAIANISEKRLSSFKIKDPVIYEVTTIPFPKRSIMTYELLIQTQYIVQMNTIIEKLFNSLDIQKSFIAPFDNDNLHVQSGEDFELRKKLPGRYIVGFIEESLSASDNFEEFTDQERIVKYSTSIRVPSMLQLNPEGVKPAISVKRTSFKLGFGEESFTFVDDPVELEKIFGKKR